MKTNFNERKLLKLRFINWQFHQWQVSIYKKLNKIIFNKYLKEIYKYLPASSKPILYFKSHFICILFEYTLFMINNTSHKCRVVYYQLNWPLSPWYNIEIHVLKNWKTVHWVKSYVKIFFSEERRRRPLENIYWDKLREFNSKCIYWFYFIIWLVVLVVRETVCCIHL